MYDPKPDAPVEFRGEFAAIGTKVLGLDFCEHMPLQAQIADKLSVIRGIKFKGRHDPYELLSGFPSARTGEIRASEKWPVFGSVVSRIHCDDATTMPHYVNLNDLRVGLERYPIADAPVPTASAVGRMQQMRARCAETSPLTRWQRAVSGPSYACCRSRCIATKARIRTSWTVAFFRICLLGRNRSRDVLATGGDQYGERDTLALHRDPFFTHESVCELPGQRGLASTPGSRQGIRSQTSCDGSSLVPAD